MITKIRDKKKILAIVIRPNYLKKKGINFFTHSKLSQQVAFMSHKKNHEIKAHIHKRKLKKIYDTNEVLFILKGEMRVDFYNSQKIFLKSKILKKNYIILLLSGGHGFKITKDCKFLEVKQGPFKIGNDKERFTVDKK